MLVNMVPSIRFAQYFSALYASLLHSGCFPVRENAKSRADVGPVELARR